MNNNKNIETVNNEINVIIKNIINIEEQIKIFEKRKRFIFKKEKIQEYNKRIEKLEGTKNTLYKKLEYKVENDSF